MNELDAFYAFLVAAVVAGLLTPLVARFATRVGAVDQPQDRGLSARETPLLGGLAILAGVLAAGALFLPGDDQTRAILAAAALDHRRRRDRRRDRPAARGQAPGPDRRGPDPSCSPT